MNGIIVVLLPIHDIGTDTAMMVYDVCHKYWHSWVIKPTLFHSLTVLPFLYNLVYIA